MQQSMKGDFNFKSNFVRLVKYTVNALGKNIKTIQESDQDRNKKTYTVLVLNDISEK